MGLFDKLRKKDDKATTPAETSDAHLVTPVDPEPLHADGELSSADIANLPADLPAGDAPDVAASQLAGDPVATADDEPVDALFDAEPEPAAVPSRAPIPFPSRPAPAAQPPSQGAAVPDEVPQPQPDLQDPRNNPNFVRVFDQYGQEVFLTREQWRDEVLPNNIQTHWNSPDELYAVLLNAMNDGFFPQIEEASAHLQEIDPNFVRGACVRAVVLLQLGRAPEAEATLDRQIAAHGPDAAVLLNLARIYSDRGETDRRDTALAEALELDANSEQALGWTLALAQERGGEEERRSVLDRLATNPAAWRARLWQAKAALDARDLPTALGIYRDALAHFSGEVVPVEFLYPMSGDLGMAGHLRELLSLSEPHFRPELHGLQVGNNLIKAHTDLGEFDAATDLVNRLFRLQRPDWRETLGFWDATLTRARAAAWQQAHPADPNAPFEIGMLEMTGPVWKRRGGPLEAVFGSKPDSAPLVTILGGTADLVPPQGNDPQTQNMAMQLADALGRISRTLPLFLSEQVEFNSAAQARALLPRVSQGVGGFVLRGGEWTDAEALEFARNAELVPTLLVKSHVDARQPEWVLTATVLRVADGAKLGTARASFPAGRPELAAPALSAELRLLLSRQGIHAEAPPSVYQLPEGQFLANYLLRLEQLLAVRTAVPSQDGPPTLSGEREILEGVLGLALQQPDNPTVRALLAQSFTAMARVRPDILDEFDDRLEMLERDRPLADPLGGIIHEMTLA